MAWKAGFTEFNTVKSVKLETLDDVVYAAVNLARSYYQVSPLKKKNPKNFRQVQIFFLIYIIIIFLPK